MSGARLSDDEWSRLGFDPAFVDGIRAGTDQAEAAYAEALHADNTDEFRLSNSCRLEQRMTAAKQATFESWVFYAKHEVRLGVWRARPRDEVAGDEMFDKDTLTPGLQGKILGLVASTEPEAYVIESGGIPRWLEFIRQNRSCVVRQCYNPLPTKVGNVVLAARGQWLIATPCCDACLVWLQAE
jgi:hypothetical protein